MGTSYKIGELPWHNAQGFFCQRRSLKIHIEIKWELYPSNLHPICIPSRLFLSLSLSHPLPPSLQGFLLLLLLLLLSSTSQNLDIFPPKVRKISWIYTRGKIKNFPKKIESEKWQTLLKKIIAPGFFFSLEFKSY